ncbi:hypothetical protein DPMN_127976 [Dreissena polymorpha]|uniref:Fibronectin type-III domain-containing protein n=1 Tax=Dreissena polymorpha TaxID=45954 RepID=A0A9D4JWZ6_DREPO|nr:hypothetical protein DPMN_127976 [Dreissena polymorpha]
MMCFPVPSSAPLNLVINREGDTTILVTWSAPDVSKRNGEIIGYMVRLSSGYSSYIPLCKDHTKCGYKLCYVKTELKAWV